MKRLKRSLFGFLSGTSLFFLLGFIACLFIEAFWPWPAGAEKYRNATGEIVEMPKGMKPPPKQAWDTTPMKLPTSSSNKSAPTPKPTPAQPKITPKPAPPPPKPTPPVSVTRTPSPSPPPRKVEPVKAAPPRQSPQNPKTQPAPTTVLQERPKTVPTAPPHSQVTPTPAHQPSSPPLTPQQIGGTIGLLQQLFSRPQPSPPPSGQSDLARKPSTVGSLKDDLANQPIKESQSSLGQKSSQADNLPSVDSLPAPVAHTVTTGSTSREGDSSSPSSEDGALPPWVPTTAGAAAGGAAALGSILTMAAAGVRPREVWDGVKDLLTQRPATTIDEQTALEEARQQLNEQRRREKEETQRILKEEAQRDEREAYERANVKKRVRYLMEGDILKEKLEKNIKESEILNTRAKEADNYSFTKTIFTCRYPDGSFSFAMAGIHMATSVLSAELLPALTYTKGFLTLTPSTGIFSVGSASYMYDDYRAAGYSPVSAATRAVGWTAGSELLGSAGGHYFGKVVSSGVKAVGTEISESIGSSVSKVGPKLGETVEAAASSAGKGKLSPTQYEMRTAAATMKTLATGTAVEQEIAVKDMMRLPQHVKAELERTGKISPAQVKIITDAQTKLTETAIDEATPKAMKEFTEKTGVKLEKATVANQSSARPWSQRSFETTDEDRTVFLKFDKESFDNYAKKQFNGNEEAAKESLYNAYKDAQNKKMTESLSRQGLDPADVRYATYVETGGTKGEVNLPVTRTEAAHQTSPIPAKEFKTNSQTGEIAPPTPKSQQSIFDERAMEEFKKSGTPPQETGTKITKDDAEKMVELYSKKLAKSDIGPYDAAKGYQRYCKGQAVLKKPYDQKLLDQCLRVQNHSTEELAKIGPEGQKQLIENIRRASNKKS